MTTLSHEECPSEGLDPLHDPHPNPYYGSGLSCCVRHFKMTLAIVLVILFEVPFLEEKMMDTFGVRFTLLPVYLFPAYAFLVIFFPFKFARQVRSLEEKLSSVKRNGNGEGLEDAYASSKYLSYQFQLYKTLYLLSATFLFTSALYVPIAFWTFFVTPGMLPSPQIVLAHIRIQFLMAVLAISEISQSNIPRLPWIYLPAGASLLTFLVGISMYGDKLLTNSTNLIACPGAIVAKVIPHILLYIVIFVFVRWLLSTQSFGIPRTRNAKTTVQTLEEGERLVFRVTGT